MLQMQTSFFFVMKKACCRSTSEGVKSLETAGAHVCNDRTLENLTCGLPKHVKEKVEAEMTKFPKITPQSLWEKLTHEEKDKHLFTAKNVKSHMRTYRKNKKVDGQFFTNTLEGTKKWASAKCAMDDVDDITDDNKIILVTMQMSPNEYQVFVTTKKILKLFGNEVVVSCCDSTCGFTSSRCPFNNLGPFDKHHNFHPVGYMFASNEDSNSYACSLESTRNSHEKLFGKEPNVCCALNDNPDAMFKVFNAVFRWPS